MFRLRHKFPRHSGIVFLMSTLYTLVFAVASPIFPLFIKSLVGSDTYVGLVVALSSVEWIIFTIMMSYLLKKMRKVPLTKIALAGFAICYAIIPHVTSIWQFLILDLFRSLFAAGATITMGLFIRDIAGKKNIGKVEGFYFTLFNIAWLAGPLAGGFIATMFSQEAAFSFASIIAASALGIIMIGRIKEKISPEQDTERFFTKIKAYFRISNLTIIYLVGVGLATWWVVLYTYVPLFVTEHGFTEKTVGITLALFTIPLILLDFIAGWLADRYGYRRFLSSAFLIMSLLIMVAAFTQNIYLFIGIIVAGCIGAAFIEPLHEAYFFKAVSKKSETRFYPVFRTGYEVGYLVAPLIFSGIMFVSNGSFKALFLVASIMMLFFCIMAVMLKKIKKKGEGEVIIEGGSEKEIG